MEKQTAWCFYRAGEMVALNRAKFWDWIIFFIGDIS